MYDSEFNDRRRYEMFIGFYWVKISLLSPESLHLRISLINFKCISRHLIGVKISPDLLVDSSLLICLSSLPPSPPPRKLAAQDCVGDHFNIPILKRFLQLWNSLFGHRPATRLAWRERTGISMKSYSPTRLVELVGGCATDHATVC